MPEVDKVYESESKWLKAGDLQGKEVKLTISGTSIEQFDDKGTQKNKICLSFEGKDRGLVLNITNARRIAQKYGANSDDWAGSEIILYPDTVDFNGSMVDCIRVRVPLEQALDDEVPF